MIGVVMTRVVMTGVTMNSPESAVINSELCVFQRIYTDTHFFLLFDWFFQRT